MKLFYFTTEQYGLEAIRDSRLKVARINELNDPFEFLGLSLKTRDERNALRKWKKGLSVHYGMICMSTTWQEPLLWSHYADKHQGLCLEFDLTLDHTFMKVNYVEERQKLNDFSKERLEDLTEADILTMLRTKFKAWKYEAEYRSFIRLEDVDPVSGLYFLDFSAGLTLAQVIVGERSPVTRDKLARVICDDAVTSIKARAGFKKFEVVENKNMGMWR